MAIGKNNSMVGVGGLPQFTYTGTYQLIDDVGRNWRIKFLTGGTLTFTKAPGYIDVFLVGGGGGPGNAASGNGRSGSGGAGGYTLTSVFDPQELVGYPIVIGAGGDTLIDGGATSAFGFLVNGGAHGSGDGSTGTGWNGGDGGSGGGAGSRQEGSSVGGTDGSDGGASTAATVTGLPGVGQGTTTREFGDANGQLYAKGGGAQQLPQGAQPANTGNGGNGGLNIAGFPGGSGIVVIRNHRAA